MRDRDKTKEQLVAELAALRQRVAELEGSEANRVGAEQEIQQRTAQLEALREMGLELAAQLELDILLRSVVSRAVELLEGNAGGLALYRPEQDVLEVVADAGESIIPLGAMIWRGEELSGEIWETGAPLVLDEYQNWRTQVAGPDEPPIVAVVGVPIYWRAADTGKEFLGTLVVKADPPRTFSQSDVELLRMFATQAAIAIRNARLYQQVQHELAERQRVEETLRESEERYRHLVDLSPDPIVVLQDALYRFVNPAFSKVFGYSQQEAHAGLSFLDLVPEHEIEAVYDRYEKRIAGEPVPRTYRLDVVAKDRTLVPCETSATLIPYNGRPADLVIIHDITERVQVEEALKIRDHAIASSINAIAMADLAGRITYVNNAWLQLYGYDDDQEVIGRSGASCFAPEQSGAAAIEALLDSGSWEGELVAHRRDGSLLDVYLMANIVMDEAGEPLCIVASGTDITERKLMEERIRAALAEKEVLLREIHHRVRNNLAVVSSLLDFQARALQDEPARAAFQESQNRIHSMARIHEHLYRSQDLARIDMVEYLQNLADHLRHSYGAYDVALTVKANDVTLDVDKAIPCGLIVNELVSNALKYAFTPDIRLSAGFAGRVRVELRPIAEGAYTLTVTDNGVGLPPDVQPSVKEALGMFLVQTFARHLKGDVEWHSEKGTTCQITFDV